ncbi:hypothetical protein HMPREF1624_03986 [Sporothrix schenckii ATCC 58251]|uniref:Uncharacterized protein n=1 Tax=Sporothrix schenckii (strain ATCC 58251 / de Perez 2211183) TaxID=1391915 RepID=U7PV15_SPOS1|nr:hypothetical protein HMPREF1624_03986 [Sporothrix schenckii ATCC 58251]
MDGVVIPETDFTKVIRRDTYAAIHPTRPELSQAGRTVVVVGSGNNIGKAIASAFGDAHAATVILVGRRQNVLEAAARELEDVAKSTKSPTHFRAVAVDVTDDATVDAFWAQLAADGVHVDVLVQCSGTFGQPKPLLELGLKAAHAGDGAAGVPALDDMMAANFRGPMNMALHFGKQSSGGDDSKQKYFVYVSTNAVNMADHNWLALRPDYILSKSTATYAFSLLADGVSPDTLQVLSFHPGMLYSDAWPPLGFTKDMLPFDEMELPAHFAVWAASQEARFLHGRYVYATWDVDELVSSAELRARLDGDHNYLRPGIVGLTNGGHRV